MKPAITIGGRPVGEDYPTYIVAEMSSNHNHDFATAVEIVKAAKEAGADAIKLQTYTPDTLTLDCDNPHFRIQGTPWEGQTLHTLYTKSYTPWEWQPQLMALAADLGMALFSTPFDSTAVAFLEDMDVPAFKIASFENMDLPLLRAVARTGKPLILSTGRSTLSGIDEAVRTVRSAGNQQLALLKCTSAYPAAPEEMNLRTIPHLAEAFGVPVGLSDHTLEMAVPIAAVTLGACIIEKHLTLARASLSTDSAYSHEPHEFSAMVSAVRTTEAANGSVRYGVSGGEAESLVFCRSLFLTRDISRGDRFTSENVRSIRPGYGLHTRYLDDIIGRRASCDIVRGTPLTWDHVAGSGPVLRPKPGE